MTATLIVLQGPQQGRRFKLDGAVIPVGRDASNVVRLHDTEVSRRHAEFRQTEQGYMVVDLGSSNGTWVNSQRVHQHLLQTGDRIRLGQTVLLYTAGTGSPEGELAEKISLITRGDQELTQASILGKVSAEEGARVLSDPSRAESLWAQNALVNLRILLQAAQVVSQVLDIRQLLEALLDLMLQGVPAERGCVLLYESASGEWRPWAARFRTAASAGDQFPISRTILDYVARHGEGILVSDAPHDVRIGQAASVVRYGITEAICVPMKGRHETVGLMYLDTRQAHTTQEPHRQLNEDHLRLAIALAHQAALAVEETRYYQALVQAERLAAIGQTIAAISHHIKNILQGLRSGMELLGMGIREKNEGFLQQGWRILEKNQARIYDLVLDMLTYSKEREPNLEPCDLASLVHDVIELMSGRLAEQHVQCHVELAEMPGPILLDPEAMHRCLLNLVTNALDALLEVEERRLVVRTEYDPTRSEVRIRVADSGPGIPAEKLGELFKPFVSTKGARGTGLGLAVSRKIVREHGGELTVQSEPGRGSEFVVHLPLVGPAAARSPNHQPERAT
ncbi:MAG: ATP-binding protein [Gemmatales bacterium]|nr:ATP-binding protein [Gemmatales bacterium]MDW8222122.1 ATP-binding protein [Gemmatales bacterium]